MTDTAKILDPVCDMIVNIAEARDQGLAIEMADREYAFCSHGCLVKFTQTPQAFIPKVEAWLASASQAAHAGKQGHENEMPTIDQGIRAWYASCRCCLSETYPRVVEQLDAEANVTKGP